MSFQATAWAMSQRCGGALAKLVLLALSDHLNRDTDLCCPTIAVLAEETEMSERSVYKQLGLLRDSGFIEWVPQHATDGSQRSNSYRLRMHEVHPRVHEVHGGVHEVHHPPARGADQEEPGSEPGSEPGIEELLLPADAASVRPSIDEEFSTWYGHYPRKDDRGGALKAYRTARKQVSAADLLAGVQRYATDPNLPARGWIPYPKTWLGGQRWLDGPLPPRTDKQPAMIARNTPGDDTDYGWN